MAVLHQAGVNVYVPAAQRGSGMGALVAGDVDHARDLALTNLRVLGNAVRDGYTVVCSEPTAALMLRQEYLKLTDDLDAALVAENTMDVGQYLAGLDSRGLLPRPEHPLRARVGYHQPCHLRALDVGTPGLDLIRGIPELDVEFIDRGCSGMAGTFGLARDQLPHVAPRRARAPEPAPRRRHRDRRHRVRRLPDADGAGRPQADPPPRQAPEPELRPQPDAPSKLVGAGAAPRGDLSPEHPRSRVDRAAATRYLARRLSRPSHVSSRSASTPRLRHASSLHTHRRMDVSRQRLGPDRGRESRRRPRTSGRRGRGGTAFANGRTITGLAREGQPLRSRVGIVGGAVAGQISTIGRAGALLIVTVLVASPSVRAQEGPDASPTRRAADPVDLAAPSDPGLELGRRTVGRPLRTGRRPPGGGGPARRPGRRPGDPRLRRGDHHLSARGLRRGRGPADRQARRTSPLDASHVLDREGGPAQAV